MEPPSIFEEEDGEKEEGKGAEEENQPFLNPFLDPPLPGLSIIAGLHATQALYHGWSARYFVVWWPATRLFGSPSSETTFCAPSTGHPASMSSAI